MTATLGELIDRARTQVRDTGGAFITDTDLTAWVNEAYGDLAARLELFQFEATGTTASNGTITLPPGTNPDVVEILSLRLGTDDVEFTTDTIFNSWKDDAASPTNTLGRIFNNTIELYPVPTPVHSYSLRYAKFPSPLTNGDSTSELPRQLDRKLVEYAVAQARYKDGDDTSGDRWLGRYEQGLPHVSLGRDYLQPGPMTLLSEPNSFERDPEAKL